MKDAIERISMAARAILDEAEGIEAILEKSHDDMMRAIADMVATGDDLTRLAEREAPVEYVGPIDAIGEPLEVGDPVGGEDGHGALPNHCTKVTVLTAAEYLPLARRTLPVDMTKRELLAMLSMGLIGEINEFLNYYVEDEVDEGGDVLWYAEQLLAEVGPPGPNTLHYDYDDPGLWEIVKKAVFHGVDVDTLGALAVNAIEVVEEVVVNDHGVLLGEVRAENIKKLMRRYPDGFVAGGGVR